MTRGFLSLLGFNNLTGKGDGWLETLTLISNLCSFGGLGVIFFPYLGNSPSNAELEDLGLCLIKGSNRSVLEPCLTGIGSEVVCCFTTLESS